MPYPSKEARNAALKARRRSPVYQIHLCTQRRLRLIAEIEKIRNKIIEIVTLNSEFKSEIPVRLVEETLRPFPIRRISSPDLTEDGAWQIENQSTQTPEQHVRLVKYKAYCQQENIDPFPHHEKEAPAVSDEFRLLDAKFDRTHAEGYDGDEVWTDEDDERHLKFFTKQKEQK
jgi:hypothetical protein